MPYLIVAKMFVAVETLWKNHKLFKYLQNIFLQHYNIFTHNITLLNQFF